MPDLPSGTVTFLFTDIEGSTELWELDRAAMAAAVDRHLTLLDAAIAAHDGIADGRGGGAGGLSYRATCRVSGGPPPPSP